MAMERAFTAVSRAMIRRSDSTLASAVFGTGRVAFPLVGRADRTAMRSCCDQAPIRSLPTRPAAMGAATATVDTSTPRHLTADSLKLYRDRAGATAPPPSGALSCPGRRNHAQHPIRPPTRRPSSAGLLRARDKVLARRLTEPTAVALLAVLAALRLPADDYPQSPWCLEPTRRASHMAHRPGRTRRPTDLPGRSWSRRGWP
jgi:hypothetical protein